MRNALLVLATVVAVAAPEVALAGQRDRRGPGRGDVVGRAVPRGSVRGGPPVYRGAPYRYYNRGRYWGPGLGLYYGAPLWYGAPRYYGLYPYGYGYGWYGYPGIHSPYAGPYAYGGFVGVAPGRPYGGVRVDLPERDAEIYVDGYYAGIVDDFDGTFQELRLEPGAHRIEIRAEGFEPVAFDVDVQPGRTITYRTALRPEQP